MIEYKQGLTARVPVRLFNTATGNPETGVVFGSVTAAVEKSDGTAGAVVVGAGAWAEVTTGAFAGKGYYNLILPVASTDTAGVLFYAVTVALTNGHVGCVKVVANEEVDTYTRIGAPAGGVSISADVALKAAAATAMSNAVWTDARAGYLDKANVVGVLASAADVATIQNNTSVLLDHAEGRWQIFDTGADANRIVFYTRAGAVLAKFDLQALDGSPSIRSPFARVPVIP